MFLGSALGGKATVAQWNLKWYEKFMTQKEEKKKRIRTGLTYNFAF